MSSRRSELALVEGAAERKTVDVPESWNQGVRVVRVVAGESPGSPVRVQLGTDEPVEPRAIVEVGEPDIGRDVLVAFDQDHPARPIVLGFLVDPTKPDDTRTADLPAGPISVEADGERVTIDAKNEIVLRCGKATITLTRAGKVLIRGAYLLSRSSGVNRIKGGSIQLN